MCATAENHTKHSLYVMKQGTHIQYQLVTMYHEGIKNHCQLHHAFSSNMLVSDIRQRTVNSIFYKTKVVVIKWNKGAFLLLKNTHTQKKKHIKISSFTFKL